MSEPIDPHQFTGFVRRALPALYDYPRLQALPLATLLVDDVPESARGPALHDVLAQAIDRLRPTSRETGTLSYRRYQYLYLRYIDVRSITDVAVALGVSSRQARRDHHDAVDVLASQLYDVYRGVEPGVLGSDSSVSIAADSTLDAEVERLQMIDHSVQTNCNEVIASIVETLRPLAQARGVLVRQWPTIVAGNTPLDRAVVRQILINAVGYAVSSSRGGEVAVQCEAAHQSVDITIRYAVDRSTRECSETASRLATCRHLLERVSGGFAVRTDGGAAEITLVLPAPAPATVLVVDDNDDIRLLFRRYLASGLYRVIEASGFEQALELARAAEPHVVTLDVMLPMHDGWELLQHLKQDTRTVAIPIIVCSVLRERDLALALGASDFLEKPVTQQALVMAIARQLKPLTPQPSQGHVADTAWLPGP